MNINQYQHVLRFITAGSVDDGKSTLIGRLLYDSQTLLSDQIDQISQNLHQDSDSDNAIPNFALLTDGLAAEREQGITIDVAYRYFNTDKRKFILADTPGHEQYTRNMVTGASTADAAIILIDASRLDLTQDSVQLLPQTLRHSALLKLLECQHIIVAINKLDLLNYEEKAYLAITQAYASLAKKLDIQNIHYLPISALHGDNIVHDSTKMPWYQGPSLLSLLSDLPKLNHTSTSINDAYFSVQRVTRQDGSAQNDFRGYQGRLENGQLQVGQSIRVLPNQKEAQITAIYSPQGEQKTAYAGEVLTITLNHEIDISRGNSVVAKENKIEPSQKIEASLCWLDERPLNPARKYWLKHGSQTIYAKIKEIHQLLNLNTLEEEKVDQQILNMNDIGKASLVLQQPIAASTYQQNKNTGSFILIDETTNQTVAAGIIYSTGETI